MSHGSRRLKAQPTIPLGSGNSASYRNSLVLDDPTSPVAKGPSLPPQLAFDNSLLSAYRMSNTSENSSLVGLIQTLYQNGNENLKSGLHRLVTSMLESANHTTAMNQELSEKHQKISELESRITNIESTSESKIEMLQVRIQERQNQYDSLASMVSEMESQAAMSSQLQHDKETLRTQMDSLKEQLLSKRKRMEDLTGKEAILKRVNRMFDDPTSGRPIQYPVIQQNGAIVDLYKVVEAWTKNSSDDDDHPYRNYTCPITRMPTSLARIGIISKIQEIALELGRDLTAPIEFEFKNLSDKWAKFGLMDQLRILAKISCMYFNRVTATSAILVKNDQICFEIRLTDNGDRGLSLKCSAQDKSSTTDLAVRIQINEKNPFPDISHFQV